MTTKVGRGKARIFDPAEVKWISRRSNTLRVCEAAVPGLAMEVRCAPGDKRQMGRRIWQG